MKDKPNALKDRPQTTYIFALGLIN